MTSPGNCRRILAALVFALSTFGKPASSLAQSENKKVPAFDFNQAWTWADLRRVPGVDSAEVDWLAANEPEAREALSITQRLSSPSDIQLAARHIVLEQSYDYYKKRTDELMKRPPEGVPGIVHVAYVAARYHKATLAAYSGVFPVAFTGRKLELPSASRPKSPRAVVSLSFDFAPADTILAILGTPDISVAQTARRISTRAFDALISHRSQRMYPVPLTRARLATALSAAASTDAVDQLYRYMSPIGLFHYAEVAAHRDEYKTMLGTLHANERKILSMAEDTIAAFLPRGTRFTRKATFYFADGADGWATNSYGGVYATDLEYFKDDYPRLINTVIHETFHAAQHVVKDTLRKRTGAASWSRRDSALAEAFDELLIEGTANYIAPAAELDDTAASSRVQRAVSLLEQLHKATDATAREDLDKIVSAGVSAGGPFYWLGSEIARTIDRTLGRDALAETLKGDGLGFLQAYFRALDRNRSARRYLDDRIRADAVKLAG